MGEMEGEAELELVGLKDSPLVYVAVVVGVIEEEWKAYCRRSDRRGPSFSSTRRRQRLRRKEKQRPQLAQRRGGTAPAGAAVWRPFIDSIKRMHVEGSKGTSPESRHHSTLLSQDRVSR